MSESVSGVDAILAGLRDRAVPAHAPSYFPSEKIPLHVPLADAEAAVEEAYRAGQEDRAAEIVGVLRLVGTKLTPKQFERLQHYLWALDELTRDR